MKHLILSLLLISSIGFAAEVGENKSSPSPGVIACQDQMETANDQYYLDLIFMRCLDDCLNQLEVDPKLAMCQQTMNGSFRKFCLLNVWGYQMLKAREYYQCIQQTGSIELNSLKGKI